MKKFKALVLILAILALLASLAWAGSEEPVNTSIDSSTWTAVELDGDTPCRSYVFQSRSGNDWKWKKTATSDNYFTVRDGLAIEINLPREQKLETLFYAQTLAGTDTIEVFIFNWN